MKQNLIFLLILIVVCFSGLWLYICYQEKQLVPNEIEERLHVKSYSIVSVKNSYNQMCVTLTISQQDGQALFNSYPFIRNSDSLDTRGLVQNELLKLKRTNWYYLKRDGLGMYAYMIIGLSPDKKQVELFRSFTD